MKKLSFVLAASMAATLITVPAANAAEPVEIFSQNFDGCSAISDAGFAWAWQAENFAIVDSEGGKALQMQTSASAKQGQVSLKNNLIKTYSNTGYLTVKYDVKPDLDGDSATTSLILRAPDSSHDVKSPDFVWNQAIAKDWQSFCNVESNVWYTVTDVIDLGGKTVMTTVARKDGAITASKSAVLDGYLDDIILNMWDTSETHQTLVDNITITHSDSVSNKTVLWSDNFDIYNDVTALTTNQYEIPSGWSNADGAAIVAKEGGNKVLQLNAPEQNQRTDVIRKLNVNGSNQIVGQAGRIGVDVDVVPVVGPDNKVVFKDSNDGSETIISFGTAAHIVANSQWTKICDMTPGEPYTIRAILDTEKDTIEAAVIDKNEKVLGKNSAAYNGANIGYVYLAQGAWAGTGAAEYDNFVITANPDALPDVEPDPAADLQVSAVAEVMTGTGDFKDTVATGIKATVTNNGNADGTVSKLTWTAKTGENTGKQIETEGSDFTKVTIAPNASLVYGLIINGLSTDKVQVEVN